MIAPDFERLPWPRQEAESHQEMNGVLFNCSLTSCGQEQPGGSQAGPGGAVSQDNLIYF